MRRKTYLLIIVILLVNTVLAAQIINEDDLEKKYWELKNEIENASMKNKESLLEKFKEEIFLKKLAANGSIEFVSSTCFFYSEEVSIEGKNCYEIKPCSQSISYLNCVGAFTIESGGTALAIHTEQTSALKEIGLYLDTNKIYCSKDEIEKVNQIAGPLTLLGVNTYTFRYNVIVKDKKIIDKLGKGDSLSFTCTILGFTNKDPKWWGDFLPGGEVVITCILDSIEKKE